MTAGASAAPGEKNNEQKQEMGGFSLTSKFQEYNTTTAKDGITALRMRVELSESDSDKQSSSNHMNLLQENVSYENSSSVP